MAAGLQALGSKLLLLGLGHVEMIVTEDAGILLLLRLEVGKCRRRQKTAAGMRAGRVSERVTISAAHRMTMRFMSYKSAEAQTLLDRF
jgi:hypothetical protein